MFNFPRSNNHCGLLIKTSSSPNDFQTLKQLSLLLFRSNNNCRRSKTHPQLLLAVMEDNDADSFIFKNVETKQKYYQDILSAEDLAWADSCLIENPEISETNMDSLKEALLDILDQHSEIHDPIANEHGNSNDKCDPENSHLVTEEVTSQTEERSADQDLEQESHDVLSILKKQPFLPHFHDEMMNIHYSDDDDAGFVLSETVMEPPSDEDIFKVWDLDVPVEEDELDKQLKEALSSNADDTRGPKTKGLKMESLDSLVESIANLSLK